MEEETKIEGNKVDVGNHDDSDVQILGALKGKSKKRTRSSQGVKTTLVLQKRSLR